MYILCLVTCLDLSLMAMFNVLSCQPHTLCNLLPYQHLQDPLLFALDALQRWDSLLKPSLRPDRRWEGEKFCPSYEKQMAFVHVQIVVLVWGTVILPTLTCQSR